MAARLARLTRPTPTRMLLVALPLVVALVATAVAAAPASAATSADHFFISGIGPTYATGHSFSGFAANTIATDTSGNVFVTPGSTSTGWFRNSMPSTARTPSNVAACRRCSSQTSPAPRE